MKQASLTLALALALGLGSAAIGAHVGQAPRPTTPTTPPSPSTAPGPATSTVPDFSGIWGGRYMHALTPNPPMLPGAEAQSKKWQPEDDPLAQCKPPGIPRLMNMNFPFEIIQTPKITYFLMEYDHMVRRVYMDATHPKDLDTSWLGHSIGRWDGQTLVIDTVGLTDETWLDEAQHPHSEDLHVVERYTRSADGKTLASEVTIEDPKMYKQPFKYTKSYPLRNDLTIMEWVCETKD